MQLEKVKLIAVAVFAAAMAACSGGEDESFPPDPPVTPLPEVEISLGVSAVDVMVGRSVSIPFEVSPEGTEVVWTSSDERIAVVDGNGTVTGVARGSVTVTATAGSAEATVAVKVARAPQVGDYYYSDGSYSGSVNSAKEVIGVVFWVGDPTADDAALRRDHPACINGLVVAAFPDMNPVPWQSNAAGCGSHTGYWVESEVGDKYVSPVTAWMQDTRRNVIAGYNNTKALEAFNDAPENAQWPVDAIERVRAFRSSSPAPAGSSDWFLPGIKELTLLMNDEHDGEVFDFNNVAKDKCCINKAVINASLEKLSGAEVIGRRDWAYEFWSSADWNEAQAYQVSSLSGGVMGSAKDGRHNQVVRCVLAF